MTEGTTKLDRILIGTDGSARAEEAARQGARIAAALGAALDIVYVVETDRPHDTDVEPEAEAALERAIAQAKGFGIVADAEDPRRRPRSGAGDRGARP